MSNHPTRPGILYRPPFVFSPYTRSVFNTAVLTSDHPTEQCELQTTLLNNVNVRPPHWTMWTLNHHTVQYELQINPLNNMYSKKSHWTIWTPLAPLNNMNSTRPTEQCELQTIPLNNVNSRPHHSRQPYEPCELQTIPFRNVNSRSIHWTMLNPDHPTTFVNSIPLPKLNNVNMR